MTVAAPGTYPYAKGFIEPQPWAFDGCKRREAVLDHDFIPPRVVRRVGWHRCLRCRLPFWSEDVARLRLCTRKVGIGCRNDGDRYSGSA